MSGHEAVASWEECLEGFSEEELHYLLDELGVLAMTYGPCTVRDAMTQIDEAYHRQEEEAVDEKH